MSLPMDNMNAEVTMLPVAAGDATLIVWSDGGTTHAVLIDAGLREHEAVSYLQSVGIFHLDLIILSHPDLDHLGGLLAIVKSRAMSVDRIWCFDLAFLRAFIITGKIPVRELATREIVYDYALRSTLDQFADILRTANGKGVQVLQVSEGYKLCLGGVLLEVLYPPQSFYDALHTPGALQCMLNRKHPKDWDRDQQMNDRGKAHEVSSKREETRLADKAKRPEMPEDGVHISDFVDESADERGKESEETHDGREEDPEHLSWRMVGTLYNNLSIVVKATFLGGINSPSVLLPGDLSDWTTLVLRQWPNLKSDILKMPHHGSKNVTVDFTAIREAIGHQFRCLWCVENGYRCPFPGSVSLEEWVRFSGAVMCGNTLEAIYDLVDPSHLLVFPNPQHHLPSVPLDRFHSNIIANRTDRDLAMLSQKSNAPIPARILVGLERHNVTQV